MSVRMKPDKKIREQAVWHEQLVEMAKEVTTLAPITLEASDENDLLDWDITTVQTGLDKLADSITRNFETLDEDAIDMNTGRLQNIENAIKALLSVENEETPVIEDDVPVTHTEEAQEPPIAKRTVPFDLVSYLECLEMKDEPGEDPLTQAIREQVKLCLRVWCMRRIEHDTPLSDTYIKQCAAFDAYDRLKVEGVETRKPTEAKEQYAHMIDEMFSEVQRESSSSQTTS